MQTFPTTLLLREGIESNSAQLSYNPFSITTHLCPFKSRDSAENVLTWQIPSFPSISSAACALTRSKSHDHNQINRDRRCLLLGSHICSRGGIYSHCSMAFL